MQTATELKEGVYYDVPDAEYRAWPAMNYSRLKLLAESVEVFKYFEDNPRFSSEAMDFGTAVHLRVNQPHLFSDRIAIGPDCEKRSNADKARWAKFYDDNRGKIVLKPEDLVRVEKCAEAVQQHFEARRLLKDGKTEVCIVWTDRETGVLCKGRIDRLIDTEMLDIKTARDVSPRLFSQAIAEFGYDIQCAFYRDGYAKLTGKDLPFVHLAVQTEPPHRVKTYPLDKYAIQCGRQQYRRALFNYKLCMKTGIWKDADVLEAIGVPAWKLREEGIEIDREDWA